MTSLDTILCLADRDRGELDTMRRNGADILALAEDLTARSGLPYRDVREALEREAS